MNRVGSLGFDEQGDCSLILPRTGERLGRWRAVCVDGEAINQSPPQIHPQTVQLVGTFDSFEDPMMYRFDWPASDSIFMLEDD